MHNVVPRYHLCAHNTHIISEPYNTHHICEQIFNIFTHSIHTQDPLDNSTSPEQSAKWPKLRLPPMTIEQGDRHKKSNATNTPKSTHRVIDSTELSEQLKGGLYYWCGFFCVFINVKISTIIVSLLTPLFLPYIQPPNN